MIKALIIENELSQRIYLEGIIEQYFANKIILFDSCKNIEEGLVFIEKLKPDIVFLDINNKNESSLNLLRVLTKIEFEIIVTSNQSKYAINAIKLCALDYLLKPVNYLELENSIKKFDRKIKKNFEFERLKQMIENISCNNSLNSKIVFPIENGFKVVKINSIMFCQSDINYTKITLDDGTSFILSKTLKIIEELLPSSIFVRVHKSYLVNFNFVFYFNRNLESYVELSNQIKIPVSIRKKDEVILKLSSI
jgi:two-component system LytT family response regulator